jgi:hypothetical protein
MEYTDLNERCRKCELDEYCFLQMGDKIENCDGAIPIEDEDEDEDE